jgi:hypothetical protein
MMRGGRLLALKSILGHADLTMTQRYAHLAPDHLRSEMAKTEARSAAQAASGITQERTHEVVEAAVASAK